MPRIPPSIRRELLHQRRSLLSKKLNGGLNTGGSTLRWLPEGTEKPQLGISATSQKLKPLWRPVSSQTRADRRRGFLGSLLSQAGDLNAARNELRWLGEYAENQRSDPSAGLNETGPAQIPLKNDDVKLSRLEALVKRRAAGEPLQYILGDQPFGELEILCEPNVLIPRIETETYTTRLVEELVKIGAIGERRDGKFHRHSLRCLDLCTGSGAIALLLHQLLRQKFNRPIPRSSPGQTKGIRFEDREHINPLDIQIMGIDISTHAIRLARKNLRHNIDKGHLQSTADEEVSFREFDVSQLSLKQGEGKTELANLLGATTWDHGNSWDVLVCNPPYVSPSDYALGGRTEKSVREHEPRIALVPPQDEFSNLRPGDTFYPNILRIARHAGVQLVVMEVGGTAQAKRVLRMARDAKLTKAGPPFFEVWYDNGTIASVEEVTVKGKKTTKFNSGQSSKHASARAVVIWRDKWAAWRRTLWNPVVHLTPARRYPSHDRRMKLQEKNEAKRMETLMDAASRKTPVR
jgi:methylase of polypeptide subunit release factors